MPRRLILGILATIACTVLAFRLWNPPRAFPRFPMASSATILVYDRGAAREPCVLRSEPQVRAIVQALAAMYAGGWRRWLSVVDHVTDTELQVGDTRIEAWSTFLVIATRTSDGSFHALVHDSDPDQAKQMIQRSCTGTLPERPSSR